MTANEEKGRVPERLPQPRSGRDGLVNFLASRLIGPRGGADEVVRGRLLLQYMMGILFARESEADEAEGAVSAGADEVAPRAGGREEDDRGDDDPLRTVGELLPSAVGISFLVTAGATLECEVSAAHYVAEEPDVAVGNGRRRSKAQEVWRRHALPDETEAPVVVLSRAQPAAKGIFGGRANLVSIWRRHDGHELVTVTLVNAQTGSGLDVSKALFQVALSCRAKGGGIRPYPAPPTTRNPDQEEEDYLYRQAMPYARGHGAAATWDKVGDVVREVRVTFLPTVDVPLPVFTLPDGIQGMDERAFQLEFLARAIHEPECVMEALESFVASYARWIDDECRVAASADEAEAAALGERVRKWAHRMEQGIELLRREERARQAFAWANRAMGMQMLLTKRLKELAERGQDISPNEPLDLQQTSDLKGLRWRPFQLAYFLGVVESLWIEECPDRLEVDIIWFPTGGGKTEAYLLLAAFELLRRRLVAPKRDTATAILSRYTLRMLTAQQFQRTSALFVALELVRHEQVDLLGERPFTLGLWVGQGLTPNRFTEAADLMEDLEKRRGKGRNPFLLDRCPRCGTSLFHGSVSPTRHWGVRATDADFKLYCPRDACEFHHALPVNLVDEALYRTPPSMLIGTVDKFANLPWDERASAFFGGGDSSALPPSLLIQDELHLIAGPLGTLDAFYEAALEEIIKAKGGARPKIIGSTATIRNAAEQVRGLYGRGAYVFPSPIRRWDDAFFFRSDPARTRRYVGVMGQGYVKPVIALVWSAAAILQSVCEVDLTEEQKDAYWTLVAYHNSRRELGRTITAARDEIATRVKVLASADDIARSIARVMELSSQGTEIDEAIRNLEASLTSNSGALDIVPCTNIISVGIDISRLGLMLVNGQPKLVAEYIQATSRVGRSAVEGLVVALFSPAKPRDRSHYEDFRAFHENLYRYVEPTSVTPLSPPARKRTLHAALVAAIRYCTQWAKNDQAAHVDFADPRVKDIVLGLQERVRRIGVKDDKEWQEIQEEFDAFLCDWQERQDTNLLYDAASAGPQFTSLLKPYGDPRGTGAPTMRSMRHVDTEVRLRIMTARSE